MLNVFLAVKVHHPIIWDRLFSASSYNKSWAISLEKGRRDYLLFIKVRVKSFFTSRNRQTNANFEIIKKQRYFIHIIDLQHSMNLRIFFYKPWIFFIKVQILEQFTFFGCWYTFERKCICDAINFLAAVVPKTYQINDFADSKCFPACVMSSKY